MPANYSERAIWAKNFKNEPFPKDPIRRLSGHNIKVLDFSDDEEEGAVVLEEEEGEALEQKHTLPHFTIMSDHGEFAYRGRLKEVALNRSIEHRCHSV